jgi:Zn-dependent protease with chaperone function
MILMVLLYIGPILAGLAVMALLFKPLLARDPRGMSSRALRREDEPVLFAFVDKLCETLRAPKPKRIEVDGQANASAALRPGLLALIRRDLTLTIGLPLAAGLDLRQLAGVMAHEFGHFSQGGAMRLNLIVYHINRWFARTVYERDAWDAAIVQWSSGVDIRIGWIFYLARLCIWLSRRVLWLLMHAAHLLSCGMSRQMEFNADRYEINLAGSEAFVRTMRRIGVIALSERAAFNDLALAYQEHRLGDNLPAIIAARLKEMPEDAQVCHVDPGKGKGLFSRLAVLFATHPSDRARIRRAERANAPGIFTIEAPATILFANYDALAKAVTMDLYAEQLGGDVARAKLVPSEDLLHEGTERRDAYAAIDRLVPRTIRAGRPLGLSPDAVAPPADPKAVAHRLRAARERFAALAHALPEGVTLYERASKKRLRAVQAQALLNAQIRFNPKDLDLRGASEADVRAEIEAARLEQEEAEMRLLPIETLMRERLACALQLLHVPQVQQRLTADASRPGAPLGGKDSIAARLAQMRRVSVALAHVEQAADAVAKLRRAFAALNVLASQLDDHAQHPPLIRQLNSLASTMRMHMRAIHPVLLGADYPFEHAGQNVNLAQFAFEMSPEHLPDERAFAVADTLLSRMDSFYTRGVGVLAMSAEAVETAIGLKPLAQLGGESTPVI